MFKCDLDKLRQNHWCLWAVVRAALFAKHTEIAVECMISKFVSVVNTQGVPGGMCQTSGGCSLC